MRISETNSINSQPIRVDELLLYCRTGRLLTYQAVDHSFYQQP
jgi:hypothetical protein